MTADLDLLPDLGQRNLESLLGMLETSGFVPAIPVASNDLIDPEARAAWAREEHLVAFPFHNPSRPFEAVDLLVNAPVVFDEVWERRTVLPVDGTDVPVLSAGDLSAMKRGSGRGPRTWPTPKPWSALPGGRRARSGEPCASGAGKARDRRRFGP